MRFVPLCVHNVSLRFFAGTVSHWVKDEVVGGVKIHVCFGQERRKVSGFIACDVGMSHDACLLALNRWFDLAEGRLGKPVSDLELLTFECARLEFSNRPHTIETFPCLLQKPPHPLPLYLPEE